MKSVDFFSWSTLTYSVDNINSQGVQDLFADILFEGPANFSRCDSINTIVESPSKEDKLEIEQTSSKELTVASESDNEGIILVLYS